MAGRGTVGRPTARFVSRGYAVAVVPLRPLPRAALAVALAMAAAACTGGVPGPTDPSAAPPSPAPSGSLPPSSGACPASPAVTSAEGWEPPSTAPAVIPIVISSLQACGPNRFVFTFIDAGNLPIARPDRTASVAFYDLGNDPVTPVATTDAAFVWAIEDTRGAYVATIDFTTHGVWGAEFRTATPGSGEEVVRFTFQVRETSPVVGVGQGAPASDTPTLDDVGGDVALLSTDGEPVRAFYETSVADALAAGEPFLLTFATPKFCASAQCGPTLDRVKPFIDRYPTVTFINVEPYALELVEGQLQPVLTNGQLTPVPSVLDWGLVSEPWIFVVDRDGVVIGSFEGIVRDEELAAALDAVR